MTYHHVVPQDQSWRYFEAERLRRFAVDDHLQLRRLLDREVGRFRSFTDLVHVDRKPCLAIV
jgi:hypothetical protein